MQMCLGKPRGRSRQAGSRRGGARLVRRLGADRAGRQGLGGGAEAPRGDAREPGGGYPRDGGGEPGLGHRRRPLEPGAAEPAPARRPGAGGRADDQHRHPRDPHAGRRLDGRHPGREVLGAFRAHHRGHRGGAGSADAPVIALLAAAAAGHVYVLPWAVLFELPVPGEKACAVSSLRYGPPDGKWERGSQQEKPASCEFRQFVLPGPLLPVWAEPAELAEVKVTYTVQGSGEPQTISLTVESIDPATLAAPAGALTATVQK